MKTVKIGVYDEEPEYVEMLCSFLKEWGRGAWILSGYTQKDMVKKAVSSGRMDLCISTEEELLNEIQKEEKEIGLLFLTNGEEKNLTTGIISQVYRFQSGREIAEQISRIFSKSRRSGEKEFIGIYSPIGGCGKTKLAVDIVERSRVGKYLYFGMEDFSSFETFSDTGELLYYIKERNEDRVQDIIHDCDGKIILGQGAFENRFLEKEDIAWFRENLKESIYDGAVFDIGTGSVKDVGVLYYFDYIFVPILQGAYHDAKVEHFKQVIKLYDAGDLWEKITFLDMENQEILMNKIEKIINGGIGFEKFGAGKMETS